MKIQLTFEFDDEDRKALAVRNGGTRIATREDLETEIRAIVDTHFQDIVFDYDMTKMSPDYRGAAWD